MDEQTINRLFDDLKSGMQAAAPETNFSEISLVVAREIAQSNTRRNAVLLQDGFNELLSQDFRPIQTTGPFKSM